MGWSIHNTGKGVKKMDYNQYLPNIKYGSKIGETSFDTKVELDKKKYTHLKIT